MRIRAALFLLVFAGCSSSGSGGPESSAECDEFCQRASQCGGCSAKSCQAHEGDLCPAGTLARLKCEAEKGSWQCINGGGWAVAYSCSTEIQAACNPADAAADTVADAPSESGD